MTPETLRKPPTRPESFTHSLAITTLTLSPEDPDEFTSLRFIFLGGVDASALPARIPARLPFSISRIQMDTEVSWVVAQLRVVMLQWESGEIHDLRGNRGSCLR